MTKQIVQLHNHGANSLLDGIGGVPDMVGIAVEHGDPGVGLSDHGTLGGIVSLFRAAQAAGITPVPGIELYRVQDRWAKRKTARGKQNFHLPIWAVNNTGYHNMIKISSEAAHSMYGKFPRTDDELIAPLSEGLIATTGCLGSEVLQELMHDNYRGALVAAGKHQDMFGKENYFVEVQDHGIEEQSRIMPELLRLARELDAPLLATNDVHYLRHEDHEVHDAVLCCQTGTKLHDPNRFKFTSPDQHYYKSADEMYELFPEDMFPGACSNTVLIAERASDISVELDSDNYHLPKFPIPEGFESASELLRHNTFEGLRERYGADATLPLYVDRANYELDIIDNMGFPDYILCVADYIGYGKKVGVLVGPGRGSAAGSLVAYANKITGLDPMAHGLLFERFLNPDRISMPDIDTDFDPEGRAVILQYLIDRWGSDRVAHISTWGYYGGKSAIRKSASVLGYNNAQVGFLAQGYPELPQTVKPPKLKAILDQETQDDTIIDLQETLFTPLLNRYDYLNDPDATGDKRPKDKQYLGLGKMDVRKVYDLSAQMEGIIASRGTHACGFLITPTAITDHFPLSSKPKKKGKNDNPSPLDFVVDMDAPDVESTGGVKFDLLGLINLTIIRYATNLIKAELGVDIDVETLALDDRKTYQMLSKGDTKGVFQLESEGMQELLVKLKPRDFSDITAVLALYRPGPMGSNFHTSFADRRNGLEKLDAPHPEMLDLLSETAGLPVFQESIMMIARHFAGFTPGQADSFRKAIGKKKIEVLEANRSTFIDGCVNQGYTEGLGVQLWNIIEPFAGYAFCKAHAAAYALISYWTAYLKANYPTQFVAACLDTMGKDRIAMQAESARKNGIEVHSADINRSSGRSVTSDGQIYLGFGIVAQNGSSADEIVGARGNRPFDSLADFVTRTTLNKGKIISLVEAGVFDSLHDSRMAMVESVPDMIGELRKKKAAPVEMDLFADVEDINLVGDWSLSGEDYSPSERLKREASAVGFIVGMHPYESLVSPYMSKLRNSGAIPRNANPVESIAVVADGKNVQLVGILTGLKNEKARSGRDYSRFTLESGNGEHDQVLCLNFAGHVDNDWEMQPVVVTGRVLSDHDDEGATIRKIQVNNIAPIGADVDALVSTTKAQEKVMAEADFKPDTELQQMRDVIFHISTLEQAKTIVSLIRKRDDGSKRLFINFKGKESAIPNSIRENGWELSTAEAKVIARQVSCNITDRLNTEH